MLKSYASRLYFIVVLTAVSLGVTIWRTCMPADGGTVASPAAPSPPPPTTPVLPYANMEVFSKMEPFQSCTRQNKNRGQRMTYGNYINRNPGPKQRAFREYLIKRQMNGDEKTCRTYAFDQGLNPRIHTGLGSRITIMQATFANTLMQDEETVYTVPGDWLWTDPDVCPERDHECYFQTLTNCENQNVVGTFEKNHNPPVPDWSPLVDRWGLTPFQLASELVYYLLKPNENMVEDLEAAKRAMHWYDLDRPILALHVRHGKKDWEGKYYSNDDFLTAIMAMQRLHGFKSLFLMTDDQETSEYFKRHATSFNQVVSLDNPQYVQHGWVESEKHLRDAAQRVARGTSSGCNEAVSTLLNAFIAAEAQGFVGVYNSNLSRVIAKLMMAINGKMPPNVSLDDFYTMKDKGTCAHEYLCGKNRKILVNTMLGDYPMSTSIID